MYQDSITQRQVFVNGCPPMTVVSSQSMWWSSANTYSAKALLSVLSVATALLSVVRDFFQSDPRKICHSLHVESCIPLSRVVQLKLARLLFRPTHWLYPTA